MKVVILHQHFNTPAKGGAIRSYYLAKALVDRNIQVVMITAHNETTYVQEDVEGIEVHYLPVVYDNKFGFLARSISFLRYLWKSVRLIRQFKDARVCYAISAPLTVGLAAIWIKRKHKIPFLFEVGDLWPDAPVQMGIVRNYFLRHFLYSLEKSIYRNSEAVVALSVAIQSAVENKLPGKKVYLIPNMADCDFYHPGEKELELEIKYNVPGKFVVSYLGAIGNANGLDYFVDCANAIRKNEEVHFLICGEGAFLGGLKSRAQLLGLQNLTFVDFQNREGVKNILKVTDAVFVCYKNVPILETGSPNKYFDGLAAGKLIVINFGGWIRQEIGENGCGIFVNPLRPQDFVEKIKPFISDRQRLLQFQLAARQLGETKYSRKRLGEMFSNLFDTRGPQP